MVCNRDLHQLVNLSVTSLTKISDFSHQVTSIPKPTTPLENKVTLLMGTKTASKFPVQWKETDRSNPVTMPQWSTCNALSS